MKKTTVTIEGAEGGLKIFGEHNLLNLHAAWFACKKLGVNAKDFVQAMASFTGASKRLEKMAESNTTVAYRDFAHAPSKVKATIEAVKQQYPQRKLIAALELHTFSSLNANFMNEYKGALAQADEAAVFYSEHALALKRMVPLAKEEVKKGFGKERLEVFTDKSELQSWLMSRHYDNSCLVLMSSGNFDGLDLTEILAKT